MKSINVLNCKNYVLILMGNNDRERIIKIKNEEEITEKLIELNVANVKNIRNNEK